MVSSQEGRGEAGGMKRNSICKPLDSELEANIATWPQLYWFVGKKECIEEETKASPLACKHSRRKISKFSVEVIWLNICPFNTFYVTAYHSRGSFPKINWATIHNKRAAMLGRQEKLMFFAKIIYMVSHIYHSIYSIPQTRKRNIIWSCMYTQIFKWLKCCSYSLHGN